MSGTISHVVISLENLAKEPLTEPFDATTVFLIVGIIIISVIVWNFLLYYMRVAVEDIA